MTAEDNLKPAPPSPYQSDFRPGKPENRRNWKSVLSTLSIFILAPVIAFTIAAYVIQSYQVDGQSMETTLQDRDRLIVNKVPRTWSRITHHNYIPKRGEIIIFNQAGLDIGTGGEKQLIKRVIGLPGERVTVKDGTVRIYNQQYPGGANPDALGIYQIAAKDTPGSVDVTLGSDEIFVCGDNRGNSEDSRYFGPIKAKSIVGKLSWRITPVSKLDHF